MTTTTPARLAKPASIRQALRIYRVMAVVAGVALFILIAAVYVHYGPPRSATFSETWSPIHGIIYFAYAVSIANLGLKCRWSVGRIVLNLLSGFVPIVPFVAERRVTRSTQELLATMPEGAQTGR